MSDNSKSQIMNQLRTSCFNEAIVRLDSLFCRSAKADLLARAVRMLKFSVELLTEYLSTRLIPEVATNYTVVRNKRIPGFSVKFVVQQQF